MQKLGPLTYRSYVYGPVFKTIAPWEATRPAACAQVIELVNGRVWDDTPVLRAIAENVMSNLSMMHLSRRREDTREAGA